MNRKWIKWISLFLVLSMLVSSMTGCRVGDTEIILIKKRTNSKTVFSVNDTKCPVIEAKLYLCNYKNLYGNPYDIDLWENTQTVDKLESYVKDVTVSELTRIVCMDLLAKEQGVTLSEDEKNKAGDAAAAYYATLTKDEISFCGLTEKNLQQYYENYALAVKLYQSLTQGVDEEVSDDEARVISIQQIFVSTEEKRDKVTSMLENGDMFSIVASTYSELATVETTVARGDLPKEVEDVAFDLDNNQTSDVIPVEGGYYFVYCVNKFEEELTDANKANILVQREKEQFDDLYAEFVKNCTFEFNDELWDSVVVDTELEITTDSFFAVYEEYFGQEQLTEQ